MTNLYAGADGCPDGWAAALLDDRFRYQPLVIYPTLSHLVAAVAGVATLLVDIPMGLKDDGGERTCDLLTRKMLPSRSTSARRSPRPTCSCRPIRACRPGSMSLTPRPASPR